jgi:hypothetical protein
MDRQEPRRSVRVRALRPTVDALENRRLLSTTYASQVAHVEHQLHTYMGELQRLELKSHATTAEYQALRDDTRAMSADASTTSLSLAAANAKAVAATQQIDRAPIDGSFGPAAWSQLAAKLTANLNGLNVPQSLIDQTVADMRSTAQSAGVTSSDYQTLALDANLLRHSEQNLGRYHHVHFPSPGNYFAQHLRGFFRGIAADRKANVNALNRDVRTITQRAGATAPQKATVQRDVLLLEQIGGGLTTQANTQFANAYVGLFQGGSPSAQSIAQFEASARAILGPTASAANVAKIDQLGSDSPTFSTATGNSVANVRRIVSDVEAVVADGLGSSPNPFKVQVVRAPKGQ